jgi:protein phosphatase
MRLRHFGHSDVGQQRAHNEDAFLADPSLGLFVVCDGVGGRARGEVASSQTVDFIWEWIKREEKRIKSIAQSVDPKVVQELCGIVRQAVQNATYMIHSLGELDPDHRGMSTTASVLLVAGSIAVIGQVGDSRVYLARNGQVSQLTEDHTLINFQLKHGLITPEQAKHSKQKNVITRAVGHKDYVEVDTIPTPVFPGDRLLLCSDGLHGYLDEAQGDELATFIQKDVQEAILESIRFANEAGGKDNITALLVEFLG